MCRLVEQCFFQFAAFTDITQGADKHSILIIGFKGKVARDIWETGESKTLPRELWLRAKALLTIMRNVDAR